MAIQSEQVTAEFDNIIVNVVLLVNIQTSGINSEIVVSYGSLRAQAVQGPDFSVSIDPGLMFFYVTPYQPLLDKIALDGTNVIYVSRQLPYTSDFDYDASLVRERVVAEYDRLWMSQQQQQELLGNLIDANAAAEAAAISAQQAAASAAAALASQNAAAASAAAALASKNAAAASATAAANSATQSSGYATNSQNSANASAASATQSANSAVNSSTYAANSAASATASANSATASQNSANASATSATNSANSATSAATQATNAANSAAAAATSATNAANSATAAANSAANAAAVGGSRKNILRRNGGFELWQRGAGGSALWNLTASSIGYLADGWYISVGPATAVYSQQPGITSQSQWCMKYQRNAGQAGGPALVGFPLDTDEIFPMLGQYVCLSFTAKCGANYSVAAGTFYAQLVVGTGPPTKYQGGAGYVGLAGMALMTPTLTTTPQRFQLVTSGVVPVTTRQAEAVFSWTTVGVAGADDSIYIDDVQLEIVPAATGYVASNFERLNFQEQLELCMRHYQKTFPYSIAPAPGNGLSYIEAYSITGASGNIVGSWVFPIKTRVSGSAATFNPVTGGSSQMRNLYRNVDCTATGISVAEGKISVNATGPASNIAGDICGVQFAVDAGI